MLERTPGVVVLGQKCGVICKIKKFPLTRMKAKSLLMRTIGLSWSLYELPFLSEKDSILRRRFLPFITVLIPHQ